MTTPTIADKLKELVPRGRGEATIRKNAKKRQALAEKAAREVSSPPPA